MYDPTFGKTSATAVATPPAPAGGYDPSFGKAASPVPSSAVYDPTFSGYGASALKDPASGKPLATVPMTIPKTFMSPETTTPVVDPTRVAPSFDPTVKQQITPGTLQNPRMKESVSQALRKQFGSTSFDELDHIMPLELGGSNDTSNLRNEPGKDTSKPYNPQTNPTATDPIENQLADAVHSGQMSLADAWRAMAKAKGITLTEDKALNNPAQDALLNNPEVLKPLADLQEGDVSGAASEVGKSFFDFVSGLVEKSPITQFISDATQKGISQAISDAWQESKDTTTGPVSANKNALSSIPMKLNADDINNIITKRQQLIESGADPKQATIDATVAVRTDKEKASLTNLTMGFTGEGGSPAEEPKETEAPRTSPEETPSTPPAQVPPTPEQTIANARAFEEAQAEKPQAVEVKSDDASVNQAAAKTVASKGTGVNALDKETKQAYSDWANESVRSETRSIAGKIESKPFEPLRSGGMDSVHDFQAGDRTGQLADVETKMNDLLTKERAAGIRVEKKANYLPQYWANSEAEIQTAIDKYNGEHPGASISLKPGFSKESTFPTYAEGEKYGLTPKYGNIPDIVNARVRSSEKAIADRKFFDYLADKSLVQPIPRAGWTALDSKFPHPPLSYEGEVWHGTVYAPDNLARAINNQIKPLTGFNAVLADVGSFASKLKNVVMSAGVPGTALNMHGFNELAATVPEAVNQPSLFTSALKYLFYPKAGGDFVNANLEMAKEASQSGLTISTEGHELNGLAPNLTNGSFISKIKGLGSKAQDLLYSMFGKNDFEKMIPALKLQMWSDLKDTLVSQGMNATDAAAAAAEKANKTFGGINYAQMGRDPNWLNFWKAVSFAPDFWESRFRYGGSLAKSFFSKSDPLASTYRNAALTLGGVYVGMNLWNKANSGKYMFQNPGGHQMDVYMGQDSQGHDIWLRPLGTTDDFLRLPLDIAKSAIDGDLSPVSSIVRNRVSTILQPIISVAANSDSFGNPVVGPGTNQTAAGQALNVVKQLPVVPQVASGIAGLITDRQNWAKNLSQAISLPIRFNAPANTTVLQGMIYDQRPKLETQVKQLYDTGQTDQANKLMSDFNQKLLQNAMLAIEHSLIASKQKITDENALRQYLITDGLHQYFMTPPSDKSMQTFKSKQGKTGIQKLLPNLNLP